MTYYRHITKTIVAVVLLSLVAGSTCIAQDDPEGSDAKSAFSQGAAFFKDGEFVKAAEAFRRAYDLKPSWRILYNIGQSEASAKRHGLALDALEKYLSQGGDDIEIDRRQEVTDEIEHLRNIVGSVELTADEGLTVIVDGFARGETPLPGRLRISAGVEHELRLSKNGQTVFSQIIMVGGAENTVVDATSDETKSDNTTPPHTEPSTKPGPLKPLGIVTALTGGALIVAGSVTGGVALSKNKKLVAECNDADGCDTSYNEVRDSRDSLATGSTVLFGVGAAAVGVGIVLLVVAKKKETQEPSDSSAQLVLAPTLDHNFAGAALLGRF